MSMNKEKILKLSSHLSKEEYLRILKEKTYDYNMTNTYAANHFLSKIQDDQIFIYYTGKKRMVAVPGFKGFEAYIRECENGITIEGRFVLARHIKLVWGPVSIFVWVGTLGLSIRALFMGIIIFPIVAIAAMILFMIVVKSGETYNEKIIAEFLANLQISNDKAD